MKKTQKNLRSFVTENRGVSLVEAVIGIALVGMIVVSSSGYLTYQKKMIQKRVIAGKKEDLKSLIRNTFSCNETIPSQKEECENGEYIQSLDTNGNLLFEKYPDVSTLGPFDVRSRCKIAKGSRFAQVTFEQRPFTASDDNWIVLNEIPHFCRFTGTTAGVGIPCKYYYGDMDDFLSNTDSLLAETYFSLGGVETFVLGDLTFTAVNLDRRSSQETFVTSDEDANYTNPLPGLALLELGKEDFDIELAKNYSSIGFRFYEPHTDTVAAGPGPIEDTTFQVKFLKGRKEVQTTTFNGENDVVSFHGFWVSDTFDKVEIRDLNSTEDNEYFGEMFLGHAPNCVDPCAPEFVSTLNESVTFSATRGIWECLYPKGRSNGWASGYRVQDQIINMPENSKICSISVNSKRNDFWFDDQWVLVFDQYVFANSAWPKSFLERNTSMSKVNGLLVFDINKLLGIDIDSYGTYCPEGAKCTIKAGATGAAEAGPVYIRETEKWFRKIPEAEKQKDSYGLQFFVIGDDNDSTDCQHVGVTFDLTVKYISTEEE